MPTTPVRAVAPPVDRPHGAISLEDLAQAVDHSEEGFALTDPDGNYVYLNKAHLRMYGYHRPTDLLGRSWRTLYTAEWVRHFEDVVLPVLPREKVWHGRAVGRRRDGSHFTAGIILTLLPDGKITCNCRDESVTPSAATAPDVWTQLGRQLVHALPARCRRPVDQLAGYTAFLFSQIGDGTLPDLPLLRESLGQIRTAGQHIDQQLRPLEAVAALATPSAPAATTDDHWPRRLTAALRADADAAGRVDDLTVHLAPADLAIEERSLTCVVRELASHALEASRPGSPLRLHGRLRHGRYELRLCHDGSGLDLEEISEPGDRLLGQRHPAGCGWAVVRCLLQHHGARLSTERRRSCETCLRLDLPLRH